MFFVLWWDAQPMTAHPTTIQIESIHGIPRNNLPGTHFFLEKCQERLTRSHQLVFEDPRRAPSCWGQASLTALC